MIASWPPLIAPVSLPDASLQFAVRWHIGVAANLSA